MDTKQSKLNLSKDLLNRLEEMVLSQLKASPNQVYVKHSDILAPVLVPLLIESLEDTTQEYGGKMLTYGVNFVLNSFSTGILTDGFKIILKSAIDHLIAEGFIDEICVIIDNVKLNHRDLSELSKDKIVELVNKLIDE